MNDTVPAPARTQYRLYVRMVPALGLIAMISSFAEADRRGLLFDSGDFALLADSTALAMPNGTSGSSGMYFGVAQTGDLGARQRSIGGRPASRIVSAPLLATNVAPAGPSAGVASPLVEDGAGPSQPIPGLAGIPTANAATVTRNQGASGPGFPDSPIGLIAVSTDTPGPVVPAVPEPASWLLMIFGVGWLGLSLRRRKDVVGAVLQSSYASG
jgi:hypothetical protein